MHNYGPGTRITAYGLIIIMNNLCHKVRELFSSTDFSINPDDISIMGGIEEGEEKTWVAVGSLGPEVLI